MTVWHQGGGGPALVAIEAEGQWVRDDFGRSETDAWGSADTGEAWTVTGGAADDYLVNGTVGAHLLDSVNVARNSVVGTNLVDVDISVGQVYSGVVPAGAPIQVGLLARWVDASNYLFARLFLLDDDTVLINLAAVVGGSETISALVAVDGITASSTYLAMRFQVEGTQLRARAWDNTTAEPAAWQVEMDHTGLDYGAVGVRSILQSGNTNTPPVIFTFDRFRCYTPTWYELAGATLHAEGGLDVEMAGRQTELDRTDNAALRLVVNNVGGPYTPGALQAGQELRQGQRIRVRETIGRKSWYLIHGTLQQSEAVYGEHENDAKVVVSGVDVFAEHDSTGRTFVSALGEYIRDAGGSSLVGLWPMGESSGAIQAGSALPAQGPLTIERRTDYDGAYAPANDLIAFGAGGAPPADDLAAVQFNPVVSTTRLLARDRLVQRELADVSLTGSEAAAVSLWYLPTDDYAGDWQAMVARDNAFATSFTFQTSSGIWQCSYQTDAGSGTLNGSVPRYGSWQLLTVHLVVATGVLSMWIDKQEFTVDIGGASTGVLESILVDAGTPGSAAAYLQIYTGLTSSVNRQLHLAQYAHGTDEYTGGLRFQRSDERFRTLCRYAGLPEPDCDYGSAWMQRAELAGKSFAQAREEAVRTEQGRAFVAGNGTPQFHSRIRTRYNF